MITRKSSVVKRSRRFDKHNLNDYNIDKYCQERCFMGKGYVFECSCCGKIFSVFPGAGVSFPTIYASIFESIKRGEYGEEMKKIVSNEPFTAVDAENYLFKCSACGHWEVAPGMSLYAPNNIKTYIQKRYGQNTIGELKFGQYVTFDELQKSFHVIKRFLRPCPVCGKRLRKADKEEDFVFLPCPACGMICTADIVNK